MPRLPEFPLIANYDLEEIQPTRLGFGLVTLRPHQPVPDELYLYLPNACLLYRRGKKSVHLPVTPFRLMKKAKELKEKHGVKKLNYKVVVKDGKVVVKASAK